MWIIVMYYLYLLIIITKNITSNTKQRKNKGQLWGKFFHTKMCPINKVLAFLKSADVYCGKMSLQSQIFQKMTELEPNHKTQN
jgi:hypothetical protein